MDRLGGVLVSTLHLVNGHSSCLDESVSVLVQLFKGNSHNTSHHYFKRAHKLTTRVPFIGNHPPDILM